jgi:hypothetical protein
MDAYTIKTKIADAPYDELETLADAAKRTLRGDESALYTVELLTELLGIEPDQDFVVKVVFKVSAPDAGAAEDKVADALGTLPPSVEDELTDEPYVLSVEQA